jgi:hypothetical protein
VRAGTEGELCGRVIRVGLVTRVLLGVCMVVGSVFGWIVEMNVVVGATLLVGVVLSIVVLEGRGVFESGLVVKRPGQ